MTCLAFATFGKLSRCVSLLVLFFVLFLFFYCFCFHSGGVWMLALATFEYMCCKARTFYGVLVHVFRIYTGFVRVFGN